MADESSEVHTPLIALSHETSVDIRSGRVWGPRGKLEKSEPWVVCVRSEPLYPKTRWTRRSLPRSGHGRRGRRGTVEPTSNIGATSCGSSEAGSTDLQVPCSAMLYGATPRRCCTHLLTYLRTRTAMKSTLRCSLDEVRRRRRSSCLQGALRPRLRQRHRCHPSHALD